MVRRVKLVFFVGTVLMLDIGTLHSEEWYVSYNKGVDAVKSGQWQTAVQRLSDAISDKPSSKANAKTYGYSFIDYFPYVYRGVAQYHLGNRGQALSDLKEEERQGEIQDGARDRNARNLLEEYLGLLKGNKPPIAGTCTV